MERVMNASATFLQLKNNFHDYELEKLNLDFDKLSLILIISGEDDLSCCCEYHLKFSGLKNIIIDDIQFLDYTSGEIHKIEVTDSDQFKIIGENGWLMFFKAEQLEIDIKKS